MACRLYNTERCLQLQLFNRPNFGVHFMGRQWYAVYRALRDANVSSYVNMDSFCTKVKDVLPEHKCLPTRVEMQRMEVGSFAKSVFLWNEDNSPVKGKRFDVYMEIAQETLKLLGC